MTEQRKAYALNDDGFPEDWEEDWGEFLGQLMEYYETEDEEKLIGKEYFEGEFVPVPMRNLVHIKAIIGALNEEAWDSAGEYAGDWPNLSAEDEAELQDVIAEFLAKKHVPTFCDIKNIQKKTITAEDL
jgi:hypothetical protein